MALSEVTTTFNVHDYFGHDFDVRRAKAWATNNADDQTIHDNDTGETRIGSARGVIAADGTGTFTHWAPGADGNPTSWQTTYHFDVPDRDAPKGRRVVSLGPFTVTASGLMTALVEEQEVPATYLSTVTALLDTYVDAAAASAALAEDISNIGTPDALVETLIENPASLTAVALSASTEAQVAGDLPDPETVIGGALRQSVGHVLPILRSNPLLGGSDRIVGGNIVPTPTQVTTHGATTWAAMFQGIRDGDGVTLDWIKDQIDAGCSVGMNAVRMIGAVSGIERGFYTRAEYCAAVEEIIDYCRSKGVFFYHALAGAWYDFGADFLPGATTATDTYPTADDITELVEVSKFLRDTGNVIGIDIVQEYKRTTFSTYATQQTTLAGIAADIRAAGVQVPLTASRAIFATANWADSVGTEPDWVDFIDLHGYYMLSGYDDNNPEYPAPTHPNSLLSQIPDNMPVILGEAGLAIAHTSAVRAGMYTGYKSLLGTRVVGAFAWALGDQAAGDTDKFGLFSGTPGGALTARTEMTDVFETWPRTARTPKAAKYNTADQAVTAAGGTTTVNMLGTKYDDGGLGGGSSSICFTIPPGSGGRYRISGQLRILAGGVAGGWDFNILDGSAVSICRLTEPAFAASLEKSYMFSIELDLPDGTTLAPKMNVNQTVTIKSGANASYISLTKLD